jgi:hypothetical protein
LGIITEVRLLHPSKAAFPIAVTENTVPLVTMEGIVTAPPDPLYLVNLHSLALVVAYSKSPTVKETANAGSVQIAHITVNKIVLILIFILF